MSESVVGVLVLSFSACIFNGCEEKLLNVEHAANLILGFQCRGWIGATTSMIFPTNLFHAGTSSCLESLPVLLTITSYFPVWDEINCLYDSRTHDVGFTLLMSS